MSVVSEVLEEFAVADFTEADVAEVLRATLMAHSRSAAAPLPATDRDFLLAHGGDAARTSIEQWDPALEERRRHAVAVAGTARALAETATPRQVAGWSVRTPHESGTG